jgi:O-antigen ligase
MAFASAALVCVWVTLERRSLLGLAAWIWPVLGLLYILNVVFITDARSGYALLGLGVFILLCRETARQYRMLILVGLLVAGGLAFAVSPRMQGKVMAGVTQWMSESESAQLTNFGSRRVFYQNSLEILQEHWMLGVGTGGFVQAYGEHVTKKYEASDWRAMQTTDPHNQYLAVWIQQGLGGLVLFLAWIVAVAREGESPRVYHRLAVALLAGWCVTSLFSSHFRTFAEGHFLATFLGVLLAAEPHATDSTPVSVRPTEG